MATDTDIQDFSTQGLRDLVANLRDEYCRREHLGRFGGLDHIRKRHAAAAAELKRRNRTVESKPSTPDYVEVGRDPVLGRYDMSDEERYGG